ncbi:MAG: hypothetical protein KAU31_14225 [Spirochaetaceae bacterium]|nr:hypothetical protein [Spirochaetaceae bacterium]
MKASLIINGETAGVRTISQMVRAFGNPDALRSCGGYIITYRVHNHTAYLGVKPAVLNGQRSNHFDLQAGPETKVFLIGGINADGKISLLFKIPKTELSVDVQSELRELYFRFANLLMQNGYEGTGTLDWITRKIMQESEIYSPVPSTILDLPVE